jgi:DNA polymerase I-like protein with 3'-5' exonuclease and polymerase domains
MVDCNSFESALIKIWGQTLFTEFTPDVGDFTGDKPTHLNIHSTDRKISIPWSSNPDKLKKRRAQVVTYITGKDKPNIIIGWNIKELFSYMLGKTGIPLELNSKIYDLKILEWYLGIEKSAPTSLEEAQNRLAKVVQHSSWEKLQKVYEGIYIPLITRVVPAMETIGVNHWGLKKRLHSHYEINGQVNGRMKCSKILQDGFNPHSIGLEDRRALRAVGFDRIFMYLDYKHMEVSVLQWLSGDEVLGKILDSGQDIYEEVWTILTALESTPKFREKCKGLFLPVVYGQGVASVAKSSKISEEVAKRLVKRIYTRLPRAMDWIQTQQKLLVDGVGVDVHGRCRQFDQPYKVRNFIVQSPAALLCLHKLVELYDAMKGLAHVAFHIHDGYVLYVPKENRMKVAIRAKEVLESEDRFFQGLRLKVSCKIGNNLDELKEMRIDE